MTLVSLLLLVYASIDQMRPVSIIESLHDRILDARRRQLHLVNRTRRVPQLKGEARHILANDKGFLVRLDVDALGDAIREHAPGGEIEFLVAPGSYVAVQQPLALLRPASAPEHLEDALRRAVRLERVRDIQRDPDYGIAQLLNIAWTSVSTSKQSPVPGLLVNFALRDLLLLWGAGGSDGDNGETALPIVVKDDILDRVISAFELLAVVASESMQVQTFVEVAESLRLGAESLDGVHLERVADAVLRTLPGLGDHVLTADLERMLQRLAETLAERGCTDVAKAVIDAREGLGRSVGQLRSRSTRVPQG